MAKANKKWMEETAAPKIGAGHAHAWLRQGAKELAQFLPAFNNGQHVVEEPGLAGNLTPGEVAKGKEDDLELDRNQEPARQMEREGREM
jgi:hypothetical protein